MGTRTAFVSIVGRANVGKSSLLNKMVGEKIAAVSNKPQTTRTKITGIVTKGETQYIFIDTPGMHKVKTKLSEHMVDNINEAVNDVETAILVVDCTKPIGENEIRLIKSFKSSRKKSILAVNKIDLLSDKSVLIEILDSYSKLYDFEEIIPISVLENDGIDLLFKAVDKNAQEEPHYFPDDSLTDQPERVIMAEIIREKALHNLNDEIPHGIAVAVEYVTERKNHKNEPILDISAVIYCEKETHKGIVIGKKGNMLQKIGKEARIELESFFQIKVNLQCWVKVKEGWRNKEGIIRNFGLTNK